MKINFRTGMVVTLVLVALSSIFFFLEDRFLSAYDSGNTSLLEKLSDRISTLEARTSHLLIRTDKDMPSNHPTDNDTARFNKEMIDRIVKIENDIAQIGQLKDQKPRAYESNYGIQLETDQTNDKLREAVREVMVEMFDQRFQIGQELPENKDQVSEDLSVDIDKTGDYVSNHVAEKLALSTQQKFESKELFDRYSDQDINVNSQAHREALENVTDPQEIEEYFGSVLNEADELNTEFDDAFSAVLDADQEEIFQNLPPDVRAAIRENGGAADFPK